MSDKYLIRKATFDDEIALRKFIDEHWRKNHVFVTSKELLDWQHRDETSQSYSFILGIEKDTGDIHGVLGFITLSQFDPEIEPTRIIWMAIWKVRDAARGHRLGRNIQSFLVETEKPQIISTVAASAMTLSMYEALGYQVDKLKQYFIMNNRMERFHLAQCPADITKTLSQSQVSSDRNIEAIGREELLTQTQHCFDRQGTVPVKTPKYIIGRYFDHPVYKYDAYKILEAGETLGIVVTRDCQHDGHKAIRIVDFIGPDDVLEGLAPSWQKLLKDKTAEYVDFYNAGISNQSLKKSGFSDVDDLSLIHI